jgi:hypothetical protein
MQKATIQLHLSLQEPADRSLYRLALSQNQITASESQTAAAQVAKNIERYIAAPNLSGSTNNLNVNYPNNLFVNQTLDRIDENIGDRVRLFVRYHWQNLSIVGGFLMLLPGCKWRQ